ncbi:LysR substrate-binding domain-containing protein [Methyloglobulus sp.]|uniref:LysR substrate-binding domain-containing protein n=1 Tax=Methyloglobulus sp. TaxID=2518622 RepID=UPI00398A34D3
MLLDEGHCLRGQALQICQLNGAEEQQDVRATGLETLRQMVRAGTGITFMPKIATPYMNPKTVFAIFLLTNLSPNVLSGWFGAKPAHEMSCLSC